MEKGRLPKKSKWGGAKDGWVIDEELNGGRDKTTSLNLKNQTPIPTTYLDDCRGRVYTAVFGTYRNTTIAPPIYPSISHGYFRCDSGYDDTFVKPNLINLVSQRITHKSNLHFRLSGKKLPERRFGSGNGNSAGEKKKKLPEKKIPVGQRKFCGR